MAKNHIISRHSTPLNLNTGRSFKTENRYDGETESSQEMSSGSNSKWNGIAGKAIGALPAIGTAFNAYSTLSGADTSRYDTALNTQPSSISISNFDALADWNSSLQPLSNPTARDLDTMSTAGKIGTGLSTIASTTAAGAQVGGWVGALAGLVGGGAAVGAGLLSGKKKRERLADEIAVKNKAAEERNRSMFLHELRDILEDQSNQAYANISAKGGKIHIAPSKRGTFKAQASRMGMSVQEAARHILANKDRYSPAMRKKAAFAKAAAGWKHEDGGDLNLFEFPVEYNHGGYFSLQPELIKINQGGTHEQNPLNGVPMGFDENGIPNLVEEGETIFDNYVFSNRLAPTEKQLAEGGLATKYKDHTFADISEKIANQFEETPVDPIARESFKESMQRLKTIQEQVREENAVPEAQQMPEQSIVPESMESVGQAPMEEQMPEEMPQEYPQDVMEQVPMQPEMIQAYGGNLFNDGGEKVGRFVVIRNGVPEIDYEAIKRVASNRAPEGSAAYNYQIEQLTKRAQNTLAGVKSNMSAEGTLANSVADARLRQSVIYDERDPFGQRAQEQQSQSQSSTQEKSPEGRKTDGVAGQTANAKTGAGNSSARANTALYKEGTTAEQKRDLWLQTSGRALKDNLNAASASWKKQGLTGDALTAERRKYMEALNAVQEAYVKAYEAGYDPTTGTSNKDAAVQALQELWEKNSGNKYFNELAKAMNTQGNSGDNSLRGWVDGLWGDITRNRNWGLSEYFSDPNKNIADYDPELAQAINGAGLTYTPTTAYGKDGYKAYTFGLQGDRPSVDMGTIPEGKELTGIVDEYNRSIAGQTELGSRPDIPLTKEQERARRRAQRQIQRENQGLPTWMRYAPIAGSALGAIWGIAQKPDYSVAEAAERIASNVPRARFNPIGNYLTYTPIDRNYYLNQTRNQGLANERAILNASGANQGAATAALLANQYNTQNAIGNSLIQQELANRQNQQQVAQFNRGTDQYNSQGLFNESVYNQRAGMQAGHYALTAAQLRQAERQRRNAAISADLTNLFQGIGDIGWENMNINMVNAPGSLYNINRRGQVSHVENQGKHGGMLTKKKSRRR